MDGIRNSPSKNNGCDAWTRKDVLAKTIFMLDISIAFVRTKERGASVTAREAAFHLSATYMEVV